MARITDSDLIALGQECVVWITGDPNDAVDVQSNADALAVIREALRLGQSRNDECNLLRMAIGEVLQLMSTEPDGLVARISRDREVRERLERVAGVAQW